MPAAKSRSARTSGRARSGGAGSSSTRREVEQATKRFEKALTDAGNALQMLGKDMSEGAQLQYKQLAKNLKTFQRDAQKTNQKLMKDLEKLAGALTPASAQSRPSRTTKSRSASSGTAKKSTAAKKTTTTRRTTAKKPAARRRSS